MFFVWGCNPLKNSQNSGSKNNNNSIQKNVAIDTLSYIRESIIAQKSKYTNKVLSVLLNDLKIPVASYVFGVGNSIYSVDYITLSFENMDAHIQRVIANSIPPLVIVKFSKPLPMDSVLKISGLSHGQWLSREKEYYGNKIVGDLDYVK